MPHAVVKPPRPSELPLHERAALIRYTHVVWTHSRGTWPSICERVHMAHTTDKDPRKAASQERDKKNSTPVPEQKAAIRKKKAKEPKAPKPDRGVAPGITG